MVDANEQTTEKALETVSSLLNQSKITSEEHEKLKEMIFDEDGVLFSLVDSADTQAELDDAIVSYIKGDADADEIAGMSSPIDGGLDMAKRRKQKAAARAAAQDQDQGIAMGTCDLGASPVMTKGLQRKKN